MTEKRPYITIPELAKELGIGKQKVWAWIDAGEIDRSQVFNVALTTDKRRQLVIRRDAVDAFLAARALAPKVVRARTPRRRDGVIQRW